MSQPDETQPAADYTTLVTSNLFGVTLSKNGRFLTVDWLELDQVIRQLQIAQRHDPSKTYVSAPLAGELSRVVGD